MASRSLIIFFVLFLSFSPLIISATGDFGTPLDPKTLGLKRKEKLTHFKFYWHDFGGNTNYTTAINVVNSTESSFPLFGQITIFDDQMTLGPELNSTQVGKAQGFYAFVGQTETVLLQAMNLVFTEGKYNGSTLTVLGRNAFVNETVREMPVVGGTGVFRFARGYVEARNYQLVPEFLEDTVQFDVYVLHYY